MIVSTTGGSTYVPATDIPEHGLLAHIAAALPVTCHPLCQIEAALLVPVGDRLRLDFELTCGTRLRAA